MTKKAKKVPFDAKVFLATTNGGRSLSKYRTDKAIFSQGDLAGAGRTDGRYKPKPALSSGHCKRHTHWREAIN